MNRILTFHIHETAGNQTRMAPSAYYLEGDYSKVAVRIYAETAPLSDAKFDIYDDGVSIFANRVTPAFSSTGKNITGDATTYAILSAGQQSEEMAADFNENVIDEGSWVYCNMLTGGGGKNFTVQLELHPMSEGESEDD